MSGNDFPSQAKIKSEVRRGNVEHIYPLIVGKAKRLVNKLPDYVRVSYGVEDIIADSVAHASTTVLKEHSNKGPAGYVTYLWTALDNLHKDKLKEVYAEKRFVRGVHSLSTIMATTSSGKEYTLADYICKKEKYAANEERIIRRIDAERAFLKLYLDASVEVRRYLVMWILHPSNTKMRRLRYSNSREKIVGDKTLLREIKGGFKSVDLSMDHCRIIQNDFECRRNICKGIRRIGMDKSLAAVIEKLAVQSRP